MQRWKNLTKQHWQNIEPEQFAHKICAKNAQNCAKITKYAFKKSKTLKKTHEKLKKNSTGAHPLSQSFSISAHATVQQACECNPHQYKGPQELSDQTSEGVDQLGARGRPGLVAVRGRALAGQLEGEAHVSLGSHCLLPVVVFETLPLGLTEAHLDL